MNDKYWFPLVDDELPSRRLCIDSNIDDTEFQNILPQLKLLDFYPFYIDENIPDSLCLTDRIYPKGESHFGLYFAIKIGGEIFNAAEKKYKKNQIFFDLYGNEDDFIEHMPASMRLLEKCVELFPDLKWHSYSYWIDGDERKGLRKGGHASLLKLLK